ncbi:hypothetical protein Nepgr_000258 [Nepenthes gracilis]|uniref:Uncharacterized protein n=1 Tax=Nepenthes gracilis TaxID=150966 RepID=A0AAD3P600_NEPGR|nr:hypothetical protein Nepgr_000258 [Nepenthes gracilis]
MADPTSHKAQFHPPRRHRLRLQRHPAEPPDHHLPGHRLDEEPKRPDRVYYEKLDVYAAYRNQQITLPTLLPPTYQGHKDTVVWSPFLYWELGAGGTVLDLVAERGSERGAGARQHQD